VDDPVTVTLRTHRGAPVEYPLPKGSPKFNQSDGPGVSWAAWTWNPITGCLHGCDYCYARATATNGRFIRAFPAGFTPLFHRERLNAPFNTKVPMKHLDDPAYQRVFVCSMADMFGKWVPPDWIRQILAIEGGNLQWEYLHLSKFPDGYVGLPLPPTAWAGTSVDEQKRVRIAERAMREVRNVKVKWLSLEPLKEMLTFVDLSMFDWVVIGAQTRTSQPGGSVPAFAPPLEWVLRLTDQAHEAGCRVHWKPNLRAVADIDSVRWVDEYPDVMTEVVGRD
jgi:protein gp37